VTARRTWRIGGRPAAGDVGVLVHELEGGSGPTVVILGGVHGDESQGVRAAGLLAGSLLGTDLAGRVLVVPVAHEAAVAVCSRTSPLDGANLARTFPGSPSGTPTERLAWLLEHEVLAGADLVIDLHSSGVHFTMASLAGYCDDGSTASAVSARVAGAMAMPVTWRHPGAPPPGRSGSGAHDRGAGFVYLESPEAEEHAPAYRDAVLRGLVAFGMLPSDAAPPPSGPSRRLVGPGDVDALAVRAERTGFVEVRVELLDRVRRGQTVARFHDPWHGWAIDLPAFGDGVAVLVRRSRAVGAGELVAFLTGEEEDGAAVRP
jgi:predicted deacylase